jgi:hypothetical protein
MSKKLILFLTALGGGLIALAAFNSVQVGACNVTIDENLTVTPNVISFETVFPQEVLFRPLNVNLSKTFINNPIYDDIEYRIIQRPKPRVDRQADRDYCAAHPTDRVRCYPSLCPYLSKEPDTTPANDSGVPAFHNPGVSSSIAYGRLAKSDNDIADIWTVDLATPCFRGECAQDWASFVKNRNPNANPDTYILDRNLEHERFGCDLVVEVLSISYSKATTRTLGFWQTHTAFTSRIFTEKFGGVMTVGTSTRARTITNIREAGRSILFGAYYASIPKKTNNTNRIAVDKARMQLLQQLVSAKLNCAAFGCVTTTQTLITNADSAYAGTNGSLMITLSGQLDLYNKSGDRIPIPPALGSSGNATPSISQRWANKVFWDSP